MNLLLKFNMNLYICLSNNFMHLLKIVIDFTASWCGPCQFIQPAINEFAEIYKNVDFIKIDVDELNVCSYFLTQTWLYGN